MNRATGHSFRHRFATHPIEDGYAIRTLRVLLGHADVTTTMIDCHVLNKGGRGVRSPLDADPARGSSEWDRPRRREVGRSPERRKFNRKPLRGNRLAGTLASKSDRDKSRRRESRDRGGAG